SLSLASLVRPKKLAAALLFAATVTVLAVPGVRDRFLDSFTAKGSGERSVLLAAGLTAVRENPLAGCGLGRFRPGLYAAPDAPVEVLEQVGKAHNQFVSIAAEDGVAHALLFALMLAWMARRLMRAPPSAARSTGLAGLLFFVLL